MYKNCAEPSAEQEILLTKLGWAGWLLHACEWQHCASSTLEWSFEVPDWDAVLCFSQSGHSQGTLALALALGKHQTIVESLLARTSFLTLQLLDLSSPAAAKLARLVLMSVSLFSPLQLGTSTTQRRRRRRRFCSYKMATPILGNTRLTDWCCNWCVNASTHSEKCPTDRCCNWCVHTSKIWTNIPSERERERERERVWPVLSKDIRRLQKEAKVHSRQHRMCSTCAQIQVQLQQPIQGGVQRFSGAPSHLGVCSLQAPFARVATAQREVCCSSQNQAPPAHDWCPSQAPSALPCFYLKK